MSDAIWSRESSLRGAAVLGGYLPRLGDHPLLGPTLRSKIDELEQEAAEAPEIPARAHAALFFSGGPVEGTSGIDAIFAVRALEHFQQMVRTQYAFKKQGYVAERAKQPSSSEARLLLCGTPRGSFGLELRSAPTDDMIQAADLVSVIDAVGAGIQAVASDDDSLSRSLDELSPRVFVRMKRFFGDMHRNAATLRFQSPGSHFSLSVPQIGIAKARLETLSTTTETEEVVGVFDGLTLQTGLFDFMSNADGLISGRVDAEVTNDEMVSMQSDYFHQACIARFKKITVTAHGSTKVRRQLLALLPPQQVEQADLLRVTE